MERIAGNSERKIYDINSILVQDIDKLGNITTYNQYIAGVILIILGSRMIKETFEEEVLKSEKPILLDFWATWCGPCMRQGPIVEALAEEGYNVGKIDVDQEMGLAQQFKVMSIPTLLIFKGGQEVHRLVGLTSKEDLKKLLDE